MFRLTSRPIETDVRYWLICRAWLLAVALPLLSSAAEGTVLGPGASREHVLNTFGPPSGQSKLGSKEILTYPQGRVTLNGGRVERIEFKPNVPWPSAPRRAAEPAEATAAGPRRAATPADAWRANFDEAGREATRRGGNIIALFTGADWQGRGSPLHDDVILHPEFARVFGAAYAFFIADLSDQIPASPAEREQHQALRLRLGITVYPTLLILSPAGEKLAKIDVARPEPGGAFRAQVIAALRDAHDLLGLAPLPAGTERPAAGGAPGRGAPSAAAGLFSSAGLALKALAVGVVAAALLFWLVWRDWITPPPLPKAVVVSARIDAAASGLPPYEEIIEWSRERVRAVAVRLAESDGFQVQTMPPDGEKDLVLRREGDDHPRAYVCCASGNAGIITVRRLRELFGMMTADGVPTGWYFAPSGFAAEAREYAMKHRVLLFDGHLLLSRLGDMGPIALEKVLEKSA
ncbi:restriction endonuclease [Horticoccus sp. 23ND18S-11]|uniref:restriction endonuclease n=1 Tax=Horticoccus sp. 23ND18S-11 TaxID=3391832 RepID=UPI0039C8CA80